MKSHQSTEKRDRRPSKIKASEKINYGVGNITYSLPHQLIASCFMFFSTTILRISPTLTGILVGISAAWDAISDPLMGYISDHTRTEGSGRRHPYLLFGTLLLGFSTWRLWAVKPSGSPLWDVSIVLFLLLVSKSALTIYVVPYNALGAELSQDYDERSSIQSYRAAFYLVGMAGALVISNMVFFRSTPAYPKGQLNPAVYPKMGLIFALATTAFGLYCYYTTKHFVSRLHEQHRSQSSPGRAARTPLYASLKSAFQNRDLMALVAMILIIEIGFQIGIAINVHVNTYTYNLAGPAIGLLGLTLLATSILSQPLWVWITRRFDKKRSLWLGMILGLCGFVGAPWTHVWLKLFPIDPGTILYSLALFMALGGMGNGAFMSIPFSMVADSADNRSAYPGEEGPIKRSTNEGMYFGLYTLAYKLGTSFSLFSTGIILKVVGFDASLPIQSPATQFNLAMVPSYLLLAIVPFAFYALSRYSIDRTSYYSNDLSLG